jgi:regulator of sigma E protease
LPLHSGYRDLHRPTTFFGSRARRRVDKVEAGSRGGRRLQVGDVVTAIDGTKIGSSPMQRIVVGHAGDQLTFAIKRGDLTLELRELRNSGK